VTPTAEVLVPGVVVDETRDLAGHLSTAVLSADGVYRYLLTRIWQPARPLAVWIMLNPSTADANHDDPTLRRVTTFTRRAGCGGLAVVNLYALRSTDPAALRDHPDPVGPLNDAFVRRATAEAGLVICAWGGSFPAPDRAQAVTRLLARTGARLRCLGTTTSGQPKHPVRLPNATPLVPYHPEPHP